MEAAVTQKQKMTTREMTLTALMTALICVIAPFSIPIPFSPVPISFTPLAIFLTVYVLGTKGATLSCILFLLIGTAGLPVFSGFAGGLGKVAGPTGGYLLGYLFMTPVCGIFVERFPGNRWLQAVGMVLGLGICYLFGTLWLSWQMELSFQAGLAAGVLPYLPGDGVKILIAVLIGPVIRKRVRQL